MSPILFTNDIDSKLNEEAFMSRILILVTAYLFLSVNAFAEWREELGTLRIGILAGDDVSRATAVVEPFRLAIQERLNIDVEIYPARDYASLVQAHTTGRVEYAVLSATAYAASHKICQCNQPLVVAKSGDGTDSFQSIIITRKGGVSSVGELSGRQAIALSKDSVGGYAFALFELSKQGHRLVDNGLTFTFGETARDSVRQFSDGYGDVLFGWSSLNGNPEEGYSRGTMKDLKYFAGDLDRYEIIWKSEPIPHRVHSIVSKLPSEAKRELKLQLTEMFDNDPVAYDAIEPIFGGGFVAAFQNNFDLLIEFVSDPNSALLKTSSQ